MKALELFAGAGGLALGTARAGFKHAAVVEWDHNACESVRANQRRGHPLVTGWPVHEMDVTHFDHHAIDAPVDLVAGGPPCQPFSLGGLHRGQADERNMFPEVFRAVRALRPKAILVENVRGLLRRSFADYFAYIQLQLQHPEITRKESESWQRHRARLEKHHTGSAHAGELTYNVVFRLLNSADYGVPQIRQRVVIVGFRSDLDVHWSFPEPTHSHVALIRDQWVTGAYWDRHGVARRSRPVPSARLSTRVARLGSASSRVRDLQPWVTVRDAISDLPKPRVANAVRSASRIENHVLQPGARTYPGHTGSPLDEPAKTLKAGVHGVPGGENMLAHPDGTVRYFTVRESARLQTFPDDYVFTGSWTETMRQLGNAVPVQLAERVARDILVRLQAHKPAPKSSQRAAV